MPGDVTPPPRPIRLLVGSLTFLLFAMPRVSACDEMAAGFRALAAEFAPARFRIVTPKRDRETCVEHGVTGFPTLHVLWRGETVRTPPVPGRAS